MGRSGGIDEEFAVRAGGEGSGGEGIYSDGTAADGVGVGGRAVGTGAVEGWSEARRGMDWAAVWSYGRGLCGDGRRDVGFEVEEEWVRESGRGGEGGG